MLRPPQVVSHSNILIAMTRVKIPPFPATPRKVGGEEGVGLAECNIFGEGAERAWSLDRLTCLAGYLFLDYPGQLQY